jgi:hypothetical protein
MCAQQRMKNQADLKHSEREFVEGDMIYLKLQPHIQSSVAPRSNHKLTFRYHGPFKILQRVGAVAYKLQLPHEAKIHPVVHVPQLKRHLAYMDGVSTDLSSVSFDPAVVVFPVIVLDKAYKSTSSSIALRILVQWDTPSKLLSWEDEWDLRRRYPDAPAWGQAASEGGRMS